MRNFLSWYTVPIGYKICASKIEYIWIYRWYTYNVMDITNNSKINRSNIYKKYRENIW